MVEGAMKRIRERKGQFERKESDICIKQKKKGLEVRLNAGCLL